MRSLLWIGVPFAVVGAIAACSSFSSDDPPATDAGQPTDPDGSTVPPNDGGTPVECGKTALYVVGGQERVSPDGDAAGGTSIPSDVIRFAIHCDGTLGDAETLASWIPRVFIWGGAIATSDRVFLMGGQNDDGLAETLLLAKRQADGTLGRFERHDTLAGLDRWRIAVATENDRGYVFGGRLKNVATIEEAPPGTRVDEAGADGFNVYTPRIDRFPLGADDPIATRLDDNYVPAERMGAAIANHRAFVVGSGADDSVHWRQLDAEGSLSSDGWQTIAKPFARNPFDCSAVVNGTDVYLIGGGSRPYAWGRVDAFTTPPTLHYDDTQSMTDSNGAQVNLAEPHAAATNGWVYVVNIWDPVVHYARLETGKMVMLDGPRLPFVRQGASVFIF